MILLVGLFAVASCSGENSGGHTTTTAVPLETTAPAETTAEEIKPDLPEVKFEGEKFNIISRLGVVNASMTNIELFSEGYNSELINDTVYRRNLAMEEKYGIKITQHQVEYPTYILETSVMAEDHAYDVVVSYHYNMSYGATHGIFLSLYDVPHIDLSKPWWDQNSVEGFSIANELYFATSDWLLMDKQRTYILYYNKMMAEEHGITGMYDTIFDGKWTLDKMNEMMLRIANDENGNGIVDYEDRFGISHSGSYSFTSFFFGCDNTVCTKDEDDLPVLNLYNEHSNNTVEKLIAMFRADPRTSLFPEKYEDTYTGSDDLALSVFCGNRALFYSGIAHSAQKISQNAEFDFGIMPFPKFDEDQENYCTLVGSPALALAVPINSNKLEMTGILLEDLAYESKKTVIPAYYEEWLKVRYTKDEDSAKILDMIFGNISYDLCMVYNWSSIWEFMAKKVGDSTTNVFASAYAAKESSILSAMNKTIEAFSS